MSGQRVVSKWSPWPHKGTGSFGTHSLRRQFLSFSQARSGSISFAICRLAPCLSKSREPPDRPHAEMPGLERQRGQLA